MEKDCENKLECGSRCRSCDICDAPSGKINENCHACCGSRDSTPYARLGRIIYG
jgi:hypothetical protein